jgi:hypothetical protein
MPHQKSLVYNSYTVTHRNQHEHCNVWCMSILMCVCREYKNDINLISSIKEHQIKMCVALVRYISSQKHPYLTHNSLRRCECLRRLIVWSSRHFRPFDAPHDPRAHQHQSVSNKEMQEPCRCDFRDLKNRKCDLTVFVTVES